MLEVGSGVKENIRMSSMLVKLSAIVLFTLSSVSAYAVPVVWTLNGVTFNDSGTASGSFTYDADTNTYSAISISTTAGSNKGAASYDVLISGFATATSFRFANSANSGAYIGTPVLDFAFSALTNAGGSVTLDTPTSYEADCGNASCTTDAGSNRIVNAGTVEGAQPSSGSTAIPTMPIYGLVLTVLGVLAIAGRRYYRGKNK